MFYKKQPIRPMFLALPVLKFAFGIAFLLKCYIGIGGYWLITTNSPQIELEF